MDSHTLAVYLRAPALADDDALRLVVDLANGVVDDVISGAGGTMPSPEPQRVTAIRFEVASRAWRNPGGWSSEQLDDWSGRRPDDVARGGVYLTDAERAEVLAVVGTTTAGNQEWFGSMAYR